MGKQTFFEMAKAGKRVTAAWWAILLAIVFTLLGQLFGGLLFGLMMAGGLVPGVEFDLANPQFDTAEFGSVAAGMLLMITFIPTAILVLVWVFAFEKRSLASFGLGNVGAGLMKFLRGGLLALLVMAGIAFGLQAAGMAEATDTAFPQSWTLVLPLLVLVLGWSVQGSTEELVARGLLFQSVGARHGVIIAFVISSAMFSLAHGANPNTTPMFFLNLVLYSVFVCFFAMREASLWGVCGYHAIWNFAQGNLFGFSVSGMQLGSDKWMSFTETGPDLITGGATGPEGGLATTIALGVSTVIVLLLVRPDAHARKIAEAATSAQAEPGPDQEPPAIEDPGETPAHPS